MFAGGVNHAFNWVENMCFTYNIMTNEIKCINSMQEIWFCFTLIKLGTYVYAIGGRQYGNNQSAIINDCEKYNLLTKRWEEMRSLNIPRCQHSAFIIHEKIYVSGGLTKDSEGTQYIEVLNPKKNRWEILGIQQPMKIMGLNTMVLNND